MRDLLVAHRGEPLHWPENSLEGYRAVLGAGALFLETDVQISGDGIPLLSHDASVFAATGRDLVVTETPAARLLELPAGYADRFGQRFNDQRITRLAALVELLAAWPAAHAFVEIKRDSVLAFGIERVARIVVDELAPISGRCTVISFDYPLLEHIQAVHRLSVGWVLSAWHATERGQAEALAPGFLFVDRRRLPSPPESLWPGPWRWVAYTANTHTEIGRLRARGFDLIETDDIRELLR